MGEKYHETLLRKKRKNEKMSKDRTHMFFDQPLDFIKLVTREIINGGTSQTRYQSGTIFRYKVRTFCRKRRFKKKIGLHVNADRSFFISGFVHLTARWRIGTHKCSPSALSTAWTSYCYYALFEAFTIHFPLSFATQSSVFLSSASIP